MKHPINVLFDNGVSGNKLNFENFQFLRDSSENSLVLKKSNVRLITYGDTNAN